MGGKRLYSFCFVGCCFQNFVMYVVSQSTTKPKSETAFIMTSFGRIDEFSPAGGDWDTYSLPMGETGTLIQRNLNTTSKPTLFKIHEKRKQYFPQSLELTLSAEGPFYAI